MSARIKTVRGGVVAPVGYWANGGIAGIKKSGNPDLAVVWSEFPAVVAGTFTTNQVKAAPVRVSAERVKQRSPKNVRGVIINSGNANACTGTEGRKRALEMAALAEKALGFETGEMLVCSTGRIGVQLPLEKIAGALGGVKAGGLIGEAGKNRQASDRAATAIMTSDTVSKQVAVEIEIEGKRVRIGGMAKGAGMIDPNMATMLCMLTTDAVVAKADLAKILRAAVDATFNRITVDGDMSTNDTVLLFANQQAGHPRLLAGTEAYALFQEAVTRVCRVLAEMIVLDGEGVSKFVEVTVQGAKNDKDARLAAEAIANSILTKCAWSGNDPNWGRILCAVGYSGAQVDDSTAEVFLNGVIAVSNGMPADTPLEKLKTAVSGKRIKVEVNLYLGKGEYQVYTTDLTTEYVVLNQSE